MRSQYTTSFTSLWHQHPKKKLCGAAVKRKNVTRVVNFYVTENHLHNNNFPFEAPRHSGSFFYQDGHITCWKVCKLWYNVFRPFALDDVLFKDDRQVASYLKVDPSLRRLTIAVEIDTSNITRESEQVVKSTPYRETSIMRYFESKTLSVSTIVSIIQQNWSAHLVKID